MLFIAVPGLALVVPSGSCSVVVACGLLTAASSLVEHRLWGSQASVVVVYGLIVLQHMGSSRIKDGATVPALQGRLLTTGPPGSPLKFLIIFKQGVLHFHFALDLIK